ncbi:hypothetical protein LguiB_006602 [Lonicera macranthoides]
MQHKDRIIESNRYWLPWLSSSKVALSSSLARCTMSRASSHFCDLDIEEEDDDDDDVISLPDIAEGEKHQEMELPLQKAVSKREKPKPKANRLSVILLDQGLFTVYKRLFVVCLALNITALVLAATGKFDYGRNKATFFSIGNILALTLCRSEAFLRVVFWLEVNLLGWSWVPLQLKTATTALLQSLGGIHSGCGISSITWLTFALVLTLKDRANTTNEIIAVASAILSSLAAFPLVRHLHHNDPNTKSYGNDIGSRLIKQQEFWLTVAITVLITVPWLTVRRVPVRVSAPSGHASIIKFQDNKRGHMMLAGAVGDFTKSLASNPPSHLWIRTVHFAVLPYLVNMYNRVLVVATGSGICVFLSFLLQPCSADVCVLWVAKGIEQNFGKEIKDMMSGFPKEKVIVHDTAVLGQPNVSQMSVEAARNWGAEVVIVTSNPEGSRYVVNACKAKGIPAFDPIWDS